MKKKTVQNITLEPDRGGENEGRNMGIGESPGVQRGKGETTKEERRVENNKLRGGLMTLREKEW